MARTQFTKLVFVLSLVSFAFPLQASIISYTSTASDTSPAVGNAVTFSGLLAMQQFDPSLGTLDSIMFSLYHTGYLWQNVTSSVGYQDYIVSGSLSFLGVTEPIWTDEMYAPITGTYRTNVSYFNGIHMDTMKGTITPESDTFQRWGGLGYTTFAMHPSDLSMFFGTGTILLPVESNLVARFTGGSTLLTEQSAGWWADLQYNYTAPIQISEITPTPEPQTAVLLLIGCFLIALTARSSISEKRDSR